MTASTWRSLFEKKDTRLITADQHFARRVLADPDLSGHFRMLGDL